MRIRAGGILIEEDYIVLMHRIVNGEEYYVIPGGGVEDKESLEEACIRELKEELSIEASILELKYKIEDEMIKYYFVVERISGDIKPGNGPEFENNDPNNQYLIEKVKLKDLENINLVPESIKKNIIRDFL